MVKVAAAPQARSAPQASGVANLYDFVFKAKAPTKRRTRTNRTTLNRERLLFKKNLSKAAGAVEDSM